jgi:hypothetical protein
MKGMNLNLRGIWIALAMGLSLVFSQLVPAEEVPPGIAKQGRIPGKGKHKGWGIGKHKGWEKQAENKEEELAEQGEEKEEKDKSKKEKKEKKEKQSKQTKKQSHQVKPKGVSRGRAHK